MGVVFFVQGGFLEGGQVHVIACAFASIVVGTSIVFICVAVVVCVFVKVSVQGFFVIYVFRRSNYLFYFLFNHLFLQRRVRVIGL